MQQQWSRFGLTCSVTDFKKSGMVERKWRLRFAEGFRPLICDWREAWIRAGAEISDNSGQRIREVLVVTNAEPVAFHDDLATEAGWFVVEGDDGRAFFGREYWIGDGVTAVRERFFCVVPVETVDSLLYVGTHG